jgi:hypothetical protein
MAEAFEDLAGRLAGLTDDEFFWEPVPGCWKVFRDEAGRWTYDWDEPDPVPSPLTTIGWRLVHIALCKVIYHEWAFGQRRIDFMNIENPGNVETAVEMLEKGHRLLTVDLAAIDGEDLQRPVLTNWGETWPAWRIFNTMIDHDLHHGAEIGVLRDLYRVSHEPGPTAPPFGSVPRAVE